MEIPSDEEIHDNVVAYWVPSDPAVVGKPLSFTYLISAYLQNNQWPPGGHVVATRSSNPAAGEEQTHFAPGARRMLVEFGGGDLDGLAAAQPVKAEVRPTTATWTPWWSSAPRSVPGAPPSSSRRAPRGPLTCTAS